MKWGIAIIAAFLLMVPGVVAILGQPPALASSACNTNLDCLKLARMTKVQCTPGNTINPSPQCERSGCTFCIPAQTRPRVQCKADADCKTMKCAAGLYARCTGRNCVCSSQQKPECYTDHDCVRPLYLAQNYKRMKCEHNKCVVPQTKITMLPQYNVPQSMLPKY